MKPLVFVHGFMGGSAQWMPQHPLEEARPVVVLDLPGFGNRSDENAINSISEFAKWALDELSDLGVREFDLLGHSMGGMIVQEMTCQAPERIDKLVLYATGSLGNLPGRFEPIETSMKRARADGPTATARRIAATWFLEEEQAEQYEACASIAQRTKLDAMIAGLEAMRDWSGQENLPNIESDTLIVWGDKDRTYKWPQIQELWNKVPRSNLAIVPGCAHAVHLENPIIFNQLLNDFLKRD